MSVNRTCYCCGKEYYYCPTCDEHRNLETWHIMFDEENCKKIFKILTDDFLKYTTRKETISLLESCDLTNIEHMKEDIVKQIKEIMSHKIVADPAIHTEATKTSVNKKIKNSG